MGIIFGRKKKRRRKRRSGDKRRGSDRGRSAGIPLLRWIGPFITGGVLLATVSMIVSGRIDLSTLDVLRGTKDAVVAESAALQPVSLDSLGDKSNDTIRVATFNIRQFGDKKASDAKVMESIVRICARFDIIALQEVQGPEANSIRRLIDLIRVSGFQFSATVSEKIGRERYAFLWDEARISLARQPYVVQDPSDLMPREPMVASFETRFVSPDRQEPFRFSIINVHTSPSGVTANAVPNELNVLDDVYIRVREYEGQLNGEEDCILLGDLNVDSSGLRELGEIPGIQTLAGGLKTNTRGTKTYDHILIDRNSTREFTGRFGVLDLQQEFGLSEEEALLISDHQPVWAEFTAFESPVVSEVATASKLAR